MSRPTLILSNTRKTATNYSSKEKDVVCIDYTFSADYKYPENYDEDNDPDYDTDRFSYGDPYFFFQIRAIFNTKTQVCMLHDFFTEDTYLDSLRSEDIKRVVRLVRSMLLKDYKTFNTRLVWAILAAGQEPEIEVAEYVGLHDSGTRTENFNSGNTIYLYTQKVLARKSKEVQKP